MNLNVAQAVSRKIARQSLVINKNSPELLFGAGIVGMVGSTVLACRATLKLEEVLQTAQHDLDTAHTLDHPKYSEKDRKKDISIIHVRTGAQIVRLYGPSIVLGGASIAALAQSHNILNQRNAALAAAYTALDKGFREYRERVLEKYGEEEDRYLRYGGETVTIADAKGKDVEVVRVDIDEQPSIYARFFDPFSPSWSKEPEYNLIFLKCQQNYANDLLHARGHVFLNEVYDMLGIERSKAGAVVGWILMGEASDNQIDFGIFDDRGEARDFVNGREGSILLDFNVDGLIYDKIDTPTENLSWQKG